MQIHGYLGSFIIEKTIHDGVIRVGGRLKNAHLNYAQRHPVLLPDKCKLTELISVHAHLTLLPAGPQELLANLRQEYWPVGRKNLVQRTERNCITCFKVCKQEKANDEGTGEKICMTPKYESHLIFTDEQEMFSGLLDNLLKYVLWSINM
ncbi:hypothetical protein J437_LFUL006239 [Ladona fulva]|uniref:Uncharacterized protein n=1 Tax=Ladona fulva TaxID=123851 RepID=A0A8K0K4N1_LADFU|nr:hypothetical protein J437_LFUL006239 [Ladona fulva]